MTGIHRLLEHLWEDYAALNPRARAIHDLLSQRGKTVINDHIALRTFGDPRVGIDVLAYPFVSGGYRVGGAYDFPAKKLTARHYEHDDVRLPRVFISDLRLEAFSDELRGMVGQLLDQVPPELPTRTDFPVCGRPWAIDYGTYEALGAESEYAAWVAAFGFRANHFTVLVNALEGFAGLGELNAFIKDAGYELNTSDGEIKGSPADLLEQSATLAEHATVDFADGKHDVPACYYEFARRYPRPDGTLFGGFVARSADKIFESTDRR